MPSLGRIKRHAVTFELHALTNWKYILRCPEIKCFRVVGLTQYKVLPNIQLLSLCFLSPRTFLWELTSHTGMWGGRFLPHTHASCTRTAFPIAHDSEGHIKHCHKCILCFHYFLGEQQSLLMYVLDISLHSLSQPFWTTT